MHDVVIGSNQRKISMRILLGFFIVLWLVGCSNMFKKTDDDKVIANVDNNKLTLSEIKLVTPKDMKEADSVAFVQNYVEKWVKNQLLLEKAELNLDKQTLENIDLMIENYRTSLLLFKYQEIFINQKLDTAVSDIQVQEYYDNHADNFRLDTIAVKVIYVQIPITVPINYNLSYWMRSGNMNDLIKIDEYCYKNATSFYLGEEWQYLGSILNSFPKKVANHQEFLKGNRYLEATDSAYNYYLFVVDYRQKGDLTPIFFVKDQIKDILINHRKVKLIKNLENNIYNDALAKKKFTIYTN
jgi:hypothetical protein